MCAKNIIASAGYDGAVCLWNFDTAQFQVPLVVHITQPYKKWLSLAVLAVNNNSLFASALCVLEANTVAKCGLSTKYSSGSSLY